MWQELKNPEPWSSVVRRCYNNQRRSKGTDITFERCLFTATCHSPVNFRFCFTSDQVLCQVDLAIQAYDSPHTKAFLLLQVEILDHSAIDMFHRDPKLTKTTRKGCRTFSWPRPGKAHMWGIALPINDYKTDLKCLGWVHLCQEEWGMVLVC